jgi:hypothetical protein
MAAALFAQLKFSSISCEFITEYAKDVVWQESFPKLKNQIYILGKQHNKQFHVNGKVDVAVTDSPFIMSVTYDAGRTKYLREMALHEHGKFWNLNIFLERTHAYDPVGRTQKTVEEAILIDNEIKQFLNDNELEYISMPATQESVHLIMDLIKRTIHTDGINN